MLSEGGGLLCIFSVLLVSCLLSSVCSRVSLLCIPLTLVIDSFISL